MPIPEPRWKGCLNVIDLHLVHRGNKPCGFNCVNAYYSPYIVQKHCLHASSGSWQGVSTPTYRDMHIMLGGRMLSYLVSTPRIQRKNENRETFPPSLFSSIEVSIQLLKTYHQYIAPPSGENHVSSSSEHTHHMSVALCVDRLVEIVNNGQWT